jgi:hypothetical protein
MSELEDRIAPLVRDIGPLCVTCLAELTGSPHLSVRKTVMEMAHSPEFSYKMQCRRCGTEAPVELFLGSAA